MNLFNGQGKCPPLPDYYSTLRMISKLSGATDFSYCTENSFCAIILYMMRNNFATICVQIEQKVCLMSIFPDKPVI